MVIITSKNLASEIYSSLKRKSKSLDELLDEMRQKHPEIKRHTIRARLCDLGKSNYVTKRDNKFEAINNA